MGSTTWQRMLSEGECEKSVGVPGSGMTIEDVPDDRVARGKGELIAGALGGAIRSKADGCQRAPRANRHRGRKGSPARRQNGRFTYRQSTSVAGVASLGVAFVRTDHVLGVLVLAPGGAEDGRGPGRDRGRCAGTRIADGLAALGAGKDLLPGSLCGMAISSATGGASGRAQTRGDGLTLQTCRGGARGLGERDGEEEGHEEEEAGGELHC